MQRSPRIPKSPKIALLSLGMIQRSHIVEQYSLNSQDMEKVHSILLLLAPLLRECVLKHADLEMTPLFSPQGY